MLAEIENHKFYDVHEKLFTECLKFKTENFSQLEPRIKKFQLKADKFAHTGDHPDWFEPQPTDETVAQKEQQLLGEKVGQPKMIISQTIASEDKSEKDGTSKNARNSSIVMVSCLVFLEFYSFAYILIITIIPNHAFKVYVNVPLKMWLTRVWPKRKTSASTFAPFLSVNLRRFGRLRSDIW